MTHPFRLLTAIALVAALGACQTSVRSHGHRIVEDDVARIRPGLSTRAEVASLLGTPSTQATFDARTWYYVNRRIEEDTVFDRELTNQDVIRIRFDETGIVQAVERFDMDDAKQVAFNEDATPTGGNEMNVFQQFIGNIGRFNPPAE